MKCKNCGCEFDSKYCPDCGLAAKEKPESNKKKKGYDLLKEIHDKMFEEKPPEKKKDDDDDDDWL